MPRDTIGDIAKRKAKEIEEYLHKNYPNQEVSKQSVILKFDLASNMAWMVFSILPQYNIDVKRSTLTALPR